MPRSPPPRRLKLHDMRHGDREPTPESHSPTSYESSEESSEDDNQNDSNAQKKKSSEIPKEPRYKFPKKASQRNPFPHGLPHANHYGAIRPRPLNEKDAIKLAPAPETPNWRPVGSEWFTGQGLVVENSDADADDEEDEKKAKKEAEREKKQGKKRNRSGSKSSHSLK